MSTQLNLAGLDSEHLVPLADVAAHLSVSEASLHRLATFKPLIIKLGPSAFRVKAGDLRAWIDGQRGGGA